MTPKKKKKKNGKTGPGPAGEREGAPSFSFPFFEPALRERLQRILLTILFVIIALFLFIGPFFRGLYFTYELQYALALAFLGLALWGAYRLLGDDGRFVNTPLEICILVLVLTYGLSLFVAVNLRDALEETLKVAAYAAVYLVTLELCRKLRSPLRLKLQEAESDSAEEPLPRGLMLMLNLLLLSSIVVAIGSIGAATGSWEISGAYDNNRIGAPFQYPNTAAAYFMSSYLLAVGLAPLAARGRQLYYLGAATLHLILIVLTFSRGAWLFLPPLMVLLILAAAPGYRLQTAIYLGVTGAAALPTSLLADNLLRAESGPISWLPFLASMIIVVFLAPLANRFLSLEKAFKVKLAKVAGAAALISAAFLFLWPLLTPPRLHSAGTPQERDSLEQLITNVRPGETYRLDLTVSVTDDTTGGHIWGLQLLEGVPDYRNEEVLLFEEEVKDGRREHSFDFTLSNHTNRLEIHLFSQGTGPAIAIDEAVLVSGEQQQQLHFAMHRLLPQRVYDRLFSQSRDRNMDRRFELFRDGLKIAADYPLLGVGGRGFNVLYRGYQEQLYHSRGTHNHFIEVFVEAGIFALLAFAGIWISLALAFFRNVRAARQNTRRWQLWAASYLPVLALGAHSFIDWNFSLGAVGIYLFASIATVRSLDLLPLWTKQEAESKKSWPNLTGLLGLIMGLLLFVYALVLISGSQATVQSQEALQRGNVKQAVTFLNRAIAHDSFRAVNYHNLNTIVEEKMLRTNNPELLPEVLRLAERAYRLEPYNPTYFLRYGDLLFRFVDIEEGLSYTDKIITWRPFTPDAYQEYAWPRLSIAGFYLDEGNPAAALPFLEEVAAMEKQARDKLDSLEDIRLVLGQAYYMMRRFAEAKAHFSKIAEDHSHYEEAQAYLEQIRSFEEP